MLCEERKVSSPVLPLLLQVLGNHLIPAQLLLPHLLKYDLHLYNGGCMPAKDVKHPGHIRCYIALGGLVLVADNWDGNMKSVSSSMPVDTEGIVAGLRSSNHLYLLGLSYLFGDGGQEFGRIHLPFPQLHASF